MKNNIKKSLNYTILALSTISLCSFNTLKASENNAFGIGKAIEDLRSGFVLEGTLTQERKFYTDGTFSTPDTSKPSEINVSNIEFTYQNNDGVIATSKVITNDNEISPIDIKGTYFFDENLKAYSEYLNYNNEVGKNYYLQEENNVTYDISWINPFLLVDEHDFSYSPASESYQIESTKGSLIFGGMLGFYSTGMTGVMESSSFNFLNQEELTSITYSPETREIYEFDIQLGDVYYKLEQTLDVKIKDVKVAKVDSLLPLENTSAKHQELDAILKKFDDNFTLNVEETYEKFDLITSEPVKTTTREESFLFDGNKIFYDQYDVKSNTNQKIHQNFILNPYAENKELEACKYSFAEDDSLILEPTNDYNLIFSNVYQASAKYEAYLPIIKDVSTNLFIYDEGANKFKADKSAISTLAKNCFSVNYGPFVISDNDMTTNVELEIIDENSFKATIVIYYFNYFGGTIDQNTYELTYSNPNTTSINRNSIESLIGGEN